MFLKWDINCGSRKIYLNPDGAMKNAFNGMRLPAPTH